MPNEIKNEASFDQLLDKMASGFGHAERFAANTAGAEVFKETMKPKIPVNNHNKEKLHLRDALISVEHPNGDVSVGFSSKSDKGYIGRFQNDGWTPVSPKSKKKGEPVAGKHFWEATQREAKGKVQAAVGEVIKKEIDKKVRGV